MALDKPEVTYVPDRVVTITRADFWKAVAMTCPNESARVMRMLAKLLGIDP